MTMGDDLETIITIHVNPEGGYEIRYASGGFRGTAWAHTPDACGAKVFDILDKHEASKLKKAEG